MNIGIDIDDTITDTFDYLMPYIAEYFNTDINSLKDNNISYCNLPEEWKKKEIGFAKQYYDKVIPNTPVKAEVSEYIKKIKEMGHFIFIITARDNNLYTDPYKTTTEELDINHICYDKLICTFNKAEACINEHIDLMIDDSIKNCKQVNQAGIDVLLFNSKSNCNIDTDFKRVNNWKEVYDYINNIK